MLQRSAHPLLALFAALALAPAALPAQDVALPPAEQLVSRYVQAIGGAEAYRRHQSVHMTGFFEMPAMGMRGQLEVKQMQPDRMMMSVTIPGMGEIKSGYDGEIAWSMDPMQGARLLEGAEKQQTRDNAAWGATIRDRALIESMETVERTEMAGTACYKVRITWKSGRESHDCYDAETGLLVGTVVEQQTAMGTMRAENKLEEYKEFGGVKFPTRLRMQAMGQEQVLTIENIEFGTVSAADLEPPAQVKALAGSGSP